MTDTKSTPAAQWREKGEADPHGNQYDCERAALTLGNLTDDELANGVFMHGNEPFDIRKAVSGDPNYHPSIAWLTAAKDRIRWLSRALVKAQAATAEVEEAAYVRVEAEGEPKPVAHVVQDMTGPKRLSWYSTLALFDTPVGAKLYTAPPPASTNRLTDENAARYNFLRDDANWPQNDRYWAALHVGGERLDKVIDDGIKSNAECEGDDGH